MNSSRHVSRVTRAPTPPQKAGEMAKQAKEKSVAAAAKAKEGAAKVKEKAAVAAAGETRPKLEQPYKNFLVSYLC